MNGVAGRSKRPFGQYSSIPALPMKMPSPPFDGIAAGARRPVLLGLTALVVLMTAWLAWMDRVLVTAAAPHGIISFELARTVAQSSAILDSWADHARAIAMLIQGVDYLYLLVYPGWFSCACSQLGAQLGGQWLRFGTSASWLVLLAIPLDAIENYALIQQLLSGPSDFDAALAFWCAVPKFALVVMATGFLVSAGGCWLATRRRV